MYVIVYVIEFDTSNVDFKRPHVREFMYTSHVDVLL